jgi:hypothetical protein
VHGEVAEVVAVLVDALVGLVEAFELEVVVHGPSGVAAG